MATGPLTARAAAAWVVERLRRAGESVSVAAALASASAMLLGATAALVVCGLVVGLGDFLVPRAFSGSMVVAACLFALSAGVAVPRGVAVWVYLRSSRGLARSWRASAESAALLRPAHVDRPLLATVLSVMALTAGLATAFLPLSLRAVEVVYAQLHGAFVWSDVPLRLLHCFLAMLAGIVPLAVLGLGLSCTHHLSGPYGRWETRATGWSLAGAGFGACIASGLAGSGMRSDLVLIAAALPALLAAVLCSALAGERAHQEGDGAANAPLDLPVQSDRWPRLLRASIVVVGCAGALAVAERTMHVSTSGPSCMKVAALMLVAMGIGVLAACYDKRSSPRSIGGFGSASALAGTCCALAASADAQRADAGDGWAVFGACAAAGTIGFAMAYGRKTLLDCVASRSFTGTKILVRLFVGSGLVVWLGTAFSDGVLGPRATLILSAVTLLALGGLLIIHEPSYQPGKRQARLCAVFSAVGLMLLLASWSSDGGGRQTAAGASGVEAPGRLLTAGSTAVRP